MKLPTKDAIAGYGLTLFYIADFIALVVYSNTYLIFIFGAVFILGAVRLYFGAKNLKSFSFNHKSGFRVDYYEEPSSKKRSRK